MLGSAEHLRQLRKKEMEKKLLVLGMAAMMAAGAANAELQAFKVNGETVSVAQQKPNLSAR